MSCSIGDGLQLIGVQGRRDHRPVQVRFQYSLSYTDVDVACGSGSDEWADVEHGPPKPLWRKLNEVLVDAAKVQYTAPARVWHQLLSLTVAYNSIVEARTALVNKSGHSHVRIAPDVLSHQELQDILHSWKLVVRLKRARPQRAACTDGLAHEFKMAWCRRDAANMWGIARTLSGKSLGPKKRRYRRPQASRPDKQQWSDFLAGDGPSGGCSGTSVEWLTFRHHREFLLVSKTRFCRLAAPNPQTETSEGGSIVDCPC